MLLSDGKKHTTNNNSSQISSVKHESVIGFTALKDNSQDHMSDEVITYQDVLLNEGGFYIPSFSRFQCPEDGFYYVTMATYNSRDDTNVGLTLNSIFELHTRGTETGALKQMGNSRLIRCSQGDILAVKSLTEGSLDNLERRTSFSAMLMTDNIQGDIFHWT